ncbi:MAG: anhydro-N-acetylmuramic acid kinase [Myxococcota bacterium]
MTDSTPLSRDPVYPPAVVFVIGLMSGTSADGVDAALVEWPDSKKTARPFRLVGFCERPFPRELQARIHRLAAGQTQAGDALRELAELDVQLGERFAEAALAVAEASGVSPGDVDGVASHGQTVAHHPEIGASLQIGNPSLIAERTGCTVIADFRARDLAAGGEGAPLAPFFHLAALADPREGRVALNLGGIANLTWLPRGAQADDVIAFDVGPANALIDDVVNLLSDGAERMDRDGRRARLGGADEVLLAQLLEDEFLRRPPPKSTGRERYGRAQAEALVAAAQRDGLSENDLVATLVEFTCQAVGRACRDFLLDPGGKPAVIDRLLVGGGGGANPTLLDGLRRALPEVPVEPFDVAGVPLQAAEAMAFSLMGRNALLGIPNHLPRCSGAARAAVLGVLVPGRSRLEL